MIVGRESSIVQLAATYEDHVFNRYITPNQEMSEKASRVTGINYNFMTNEMVHNNQSISQPCTTSFVRYYTVFDVTW